MEWFPALRKRLAARGVHLPDPYPYTARTFKGSVLATLLAAILFLIAYAVWEAASYTARSVQRTAFITIETTAATSRLVTEKTEQAVEALFGGTELHFRATDCIQEEMWSKFRLNVCNNLPQAILGAGVGCYRDSVHMKAISDGLRRELEAIAAAKGIDMQKVDAVSGKGCAVKPSARYSTLQDLDAGRHTEIDMFSGALIRMGKELGIPTPYNEFAYHMIKALEEKNDGKFDYTGPNQEMTWAR